jgi:hypothetical protein
MDTSDRSDDDERAPASGRDVISSLPRHRPHRRSAKRAASRPSAATAKAAEKTEANGSARPKARATAAKPKAASAKATPKPKPSGTTRSPRERIGATAGAKTRDASARTTSRPRPAEPTAEKPAGPPSGTELIGTAVQAAGELAQIGLKLGTQAVKNAVGRLPKP